MYKATKLDSFLAEFTCRLFEGLLVESQDTALKTASGGTAFAGIRLFSNLAQTLSAEL